MAAAGVRAAPHRPPSVVGLLRLAALDIAVVRARMHRLKELLPEEKVELMVRRCTELSGGAGKGSGRRAYRAQHKAYMASSFSVRL